ncbi:hypothetical protein K440DRAFT_643362 [Wilcoxina mikolae CBS 423.85]|nr:hypothetical protein K440DRAFT_643362 [Wilcoxina mikolae CBS 423.85]
MDTLLPFLYRNYLQLFLSLGLHNWSLSTVTSFLGLVVVYAFLHYTNRYTQNSVLTSTPLDLLVSIYDAIDPSWILWKRIRKVRILGEDIDTVLLLAERMAAEVDAGMQKVSSLWKEAQVAQQRLNTILVELTVASFKGTREVANRISAVISVLPYPPQLYQYYASSSTSANDSTPPLPPPSVTVEKVTPSSPNDLFSTREGFPSGHPEYVGTPSDMYDTPEELPSVYSQFEGYIGTPNTVSPSERVAAKRRGLRK